MTVRPTVDEIENFFSAWGPIVRAAAGSEVCAAIDAVFNPEPVEVTPWEDWTWADVQAEIEADRRESVNFAHRIMGEPEVDPWEHANTRAHVESVIEQVQRMIENGETRVSNSR
jgi:hypothetical protein